MVSDGGGRMPAKKGRTKWVVCGGISMSEKELTIALDDLNEHYVSIVNLAVQFAVNGVFYGIFRLILFAGILPSLSLATGFRPWLKKTPLQG